MQTGDVEIAEVSVRPRIISRNRQNQIESFSKRYTGQPYSFKASVSESVTREEKRFLSDTSAEKNASLRRSLAKVRVPVATQEEFLPRNLEKYAKEDKASSSARETAQENSRETSVSATITRADNSLLDVVLAVDGLRIEASRREAQRLRDLARRLAERAEGVLMEMAAAAADGPGPTAVPRPQDATAASWRERHGADSPPTPELGAAAPPQSPRSPAYTFPPAVRAPPRFLRAAAGLAEGAEKTAELVSVSASLADLPMTPHELSPSRSRSTAPPTAEAEGLGGGAHGSGTTGVGRTSLPPRVRGDCGEAPDGGLGPNGSSRADLEAVRICRVAEELGLRPLGVDEAGADLWISEELLDGAPPGPMAAFMEASKLYKHVFYMLFREELPCSHERAEAVAHLWSSVDNFLLKVASVAEQHFRNSIHERHHRSQVERSLQAVSAQLSSMLKAKEEAEMELARLRARVPSSRSSPEPRAPPLDRRLPSAGLSLHPSLASAEAAPPKNLRHAATCTSIDGMNMDAAQVIRDSMAFASMSPYRADHSEVTGKSLASVDAALENICYREPGKMRLTPIAAEEWEPRTDTKGAAPLGPEEIGAQVRAELQNTEVNRLKLSHLDLSRQNESLRMENRRIAAEARKEIREAQGGVSVLRQQLYRAQALLRSRVVLTLNGLQKHAPDVNSALSFPREPPRSRNSPKKPVRIPLGHATGNADLFQDESLALGKAQPSGDVFSAEGGEEEGTGSSCHVKQPSHLHRRWNNVTDMYASTPSYNPSTASCVKVQYDVRDILEEAKQRTDAAVNEAEAFGALCNNIHRNHVRQVLSAAADASLSHGMDFFCKIFLEKMEDSVREAANEALGVT